MGATRGNGNEPVCSDAAAAFISLRRPMADMGDIEGDAIEGGAIQIEDRRWWLTRAQAMTNTVPRRLRRIAQRREDFGAGAPAIKCHWHEPRGRARGAFLFLPVSYRAD